MDGTGFDAYWERLARGRHSRRRLLSGSTAFVAGGAALGFVGCSSSSKSAGTKNSASAPPAGSSSAVSGSAATGATPQPRRGGVMRHYNDHETRNYPLDPMVQTPFLGQAYRLWYQGLLNYSNRTYELGPELAQKWEQPSQTVLLLTLQPNVKWQNKGGTNGRPLTSDDVVYSLERVRTPDPQFTAGSLFKDYKFEAPDRTTVRVTSPSPDVTALAKLAGDQALMMAKEVVDKAGKFATADTVVGTGPFILQSLAQQSGSESVRNPDYWRPGLPYLDGFRTIHFGSPSDDRAFAAFQAGQLDVVVVPGKDTKDYINAQPKGYTPEWYKDPGVNSQAVANTKVPPFDDARVTRALRLLIDHDEFNTAWAEPIFGHGEYAAIFAASLDGWDFSQDEYKSKFLEWQQPKDNAVREALSLLSAAGFTRDKPLKFEMSSASVDFGQAGAVLLQSQWKRLGQGVIDTTLKLLDDATYQQARAGRNYAFLHNSNASSLQEPDTWLNQIYRTGATRNYSNFPDATLDALIDKQHVTFDVNQRKQQIKDIIAYTVDHWPGVITAADLTLNGIKPNVRGYGPEWFMFGDQFDHVWLAS